MILKARTLEEQRRIFDQKFAPLFDRRALRWLVNRPASLYGLGIPPAQFQGFGGRERGRRGGCAKKRLERFACGFPLSENYFAWQAFGRRYAPAGGPLPPYLDPANFAVVRRTRRGSRFTTLRLRIILPARRDGSLDRYVLLDAQDWMNDATLTRALAGNHPDGPPWRARDLPHRGRGDDPSGTHTGTHPLPLALCGPRPPGSSP